jgi:hypothetical protein
MSLLRLIKVGVTGSRLVNLSKVSTIERDRAHIIYTFSGMRNSIFHTCAVALYSTEDEAKLAFDDILKDMNNYYQTKPK